MLETKTFHVCPIKDLFPHKTKGTDCACHPRWYWITDSEKLVVHTSWDRREVYERLELLWPVYEGFGVHA